METLKSQLPAILQNKITSSLGGTAILASLIGIVKSFKTGNTELLCVSASALFSGIGHLFAKDSEPPKPA